MIGKQMKAPPPILHLWALCFAFIAKVEIINHVEAQTPPAHRTTDPHEARALNAIFARWRITARAGWNISGELCSGTAIDDTVLNFSPGIKCDCSFNSGTICHITSLMVYSMSDWNSSSYVVGPLPNELWTFTYLTSLNLGQNYLTGTIPPSVSNLTRIQYLSLGINALSGQLPRELGLLTNLVSLAVGTNNLTGPLPHELGNCTRLTQLYIDSSGVSGAIPSTFANLHNLQIVFASDIELTGRIPDFIGSWSQLVFLRFEGTSLQGPIPSTFSNLTSLVDLRICDITNSSFQLDVFTNMTSLTTLVLRNNSISGSIPSNFYELGTLSLLDLSFNSLTGQIPSLIFNQSSLVYLFLGNNSLTGSLPEQKIPGLQYIDLSYNELSGSFPSWVNQQNLQLNLVANNFSMQSTNSSGLLVGLNCLQRSFPCHRGDPQYSNFAIKCGGPHMRSSTQIMYEADDATLGPATYFVTRDDRWAVSNAGLPSGSSNPEYMTSSNTIIPNTRDLELFQGARISAGSLRYYGLGLENGNYSVILQFAETIIPNPPVWQSLGRRVFDIYVQGTLQLRDFDIRREAGGNSFRVVAREFIAPVTENYLEIHLLWAGKGTCCVPRQGTYGPSISTISVTPSDFISTVSNNAPNGPNNPTIENSRVGITVGIVISAVGVIFLSLCILLMVRRRKKQKSHEDKDILGIDVKPYTFSYKELREATNDFSTANKLGQGGFGPVYKGKLRDERVVAVKQLLVASDQGKSQFVAEIATMSAVQHHNLVKLHGCCIAGEKRLLVYEYFENSSLDRALFGNRSLCLDWPTRFAICLGVARGLTCLHEESRPRIIHRDVKASNILLDSQLNPKISDFALAKFYDDTKSHISTHVAGTIGYLAPEYAMRGHLTEKADVFSFGVVALEIISGRANSDPNLDEDKRYLLDWVWFCHENYRDMELVDKNMAEFNDDEVRRVIEVAFLCNQATPVLRPSMSQVVAMLSGDVEIPIVTSKPAYLTELNLKDIDTFEDIDDPSLSVTETNYSSRTLTTSQYSFRAHALWCS